MKKLFLTMKELAILFLCLVHRIFGVISLFIVLAMGALLLDALLVLAENHPDFWLVRYLPDWSPTSTDLLTTLLLFFALVWIHKAILVISTNLEKFE